METYELTEAAERAGVSVDELGRLVELGILRPNAGNRFTPGHLRRAGLVKSLTAAGIPLDGLGSAIRSGRISLDFLDAPAFERFSALSGVTFAEVAERTGVPVELLLFIREAAGSVAPTPGDRIRDDELPYADLIETAVKVGFRPAAIQQLIRVQGDSLRRVAETESAMWQAEVVAPAMQAGKRPDEILGIDFGDRMSVLTEQAMVAMYHLQQARAWTGGIIEGLEMALADAGLHSRLEHPPGDVLPGHHGLHPPDPGARRRRSGRPGRAARPDRAADVGQARRPGREVARRRGDAPLPESRAWRAWRRSTWSTGVSEAGLPPAHVGLHAGPVIFQEGDYYGQTVNLASRIADYARPGEVIVSQAVVDASAGTAVAFREVGPVELKGVSGAMRLHAASRTG